MSTRVRLLCGAALLVFGVLHSALAQTGEVAKCFATPEAAAQTIVAGESRSPLTVTGFRAKDVLIDPVLRKAWVRVADCSGGLKALRLVPLTLSVATATAAGPADSSSNSNLARLENPVSTIAERHPIQPSALRVTLIHANDPVEIVYSTSSLHLTVHGMALTEAALGERVRVRMTGSDEAGQSRPEITAIATGNGRAEVR